MLNGAEYEIKVSDDVYGLLDVLSTYKPDIVIIGDYFMRDEDVLSLVDLVLNKIKIKPKAVIVHGLFERHDSFEIRLKKLGVKHCIQNIMDNEQIMKMNRKLTDFVAQECIRHRLVKKED